ncbi:MAG: glycoside hydrolase family 3 C-terminal domain-containing protein, partial [Caulobacter sp.]
VHSGPESRRHTEDVHPSAYDLEDTYLPAFRAAVVEAKVGSVMCAYNAVDGVPACGSEALLKDRLRGDWGFKGHVVTDCAAMINFFTAKPVGHGYSADPTKAVATAFNAGTDLICNEFGYNKSSEPGPIIEAVKTGALSQAVLDRAVTRIFADRYRLGLFDPVSASPYGAIGPRDYDTPAHRQLSLKTARASMVLLKNDGLLPLKAAPRKIAVIGPNADSLDALVGNYNGTPSAPVTIVDGLRARFKDAQITLATGTGLTGPMWRATPDAALCVDAACTGKGVRAEAFDNTELSGKPVEVRTDEGVRFGWGRPTRVQRSTAIRWTGHITSLESGEHHLRLASENGYRLYVDGKLVANAWEGGQAGDSGGVVRLQAGQRHALVVESFQSGLRGDQRLQWSLPSESAEPALAAARDADLVVFAGGLSPKLEGEEMRVTAAGFSGGDRTTLDLTAPQEALLKRLHAQGKPVVLVLMNGSALSVNWADANLPAIIEAWYPGGEGGQAVAELIAGDFSPAGRLPLTFYKSAEDLPAFTDYAMKGRTYRYFAGDPLYPFGHGLSFTRFAYGPAALSRATTKPGQVVEVSTEVANTGERDGDEVVQLYLTHKRDGAPIRALQGFERIHLARGERKVVTFKLDERALSVVDAQGVRRFAPGEVEIFVGGGQPAQRAGLALAPGSWARLTLKGHSALPK